MPLETVPDWEQRLARQDAFWRREVLDRPPVHIQFPKAEPSVSAPASHHPTLRDRWWDAGYQAELAAANVANTEWLGDALPHAWTNLGPEVFPAFFGCELEFGEDTSWSKPILDTWDDADKVAFSTDNPYWKKLAELTQAYLDAGRGRFYTALSDFHGAADTLAAFRDPANLNIDLLEEPDRVAAMTKTLEQRFLWVIDFYLDWMQRERQAIGNWATIVSSKRWYVPSDDFSCMISGPMWRRTFLPGIAEQCAHLEASLYHLDGPNALRHLDDLLAIPELTAIQWIYGAGNGRATDWLDVYRRIQAAGKGIQVWLYLDEIDTFTEALRPEGVFVITQDVRDRETADAVLKRLSKWV